MDHLADHLLVGLCREGIIARVFGMFHDCVQRVIAQEPVFSCRVWDLMRARVVQHLPCEQRRHPVIKLFTRMADPVGKRLFPGLLDACKDIMQHLCFMVCAFFGRFLQSGHGVTDIVVDRIPKGFRLLRLRGKVQERLVVFIMRFVQDRTCAQQAPL